MRTAILAAAVATLMSTQAFAGDLAQNTQTDDQSISQQKQTIAELPTLGALPEVPLNGDDCAVEAHNLTCDEEAYNLMRENVSEWFAEQVLDTPEGHKAMTKFAERVHDQPLPGPSEGAMFP